MADPLCGERSAPRAAAAPPPAHVGEALLLPLVVGAVLRHGSKLRAAGGGGVRRHAGEHAAPRRRHRRRHRQGAVPAPAAPALQACHRVPAGPGLPPGVGAGPPRLQPAHHPQLSARLRAALPRRLLMGAMRRCNMHAQGKEGCGPSPPAWGGHRAGVRLPRPLRRGCGAVHPIIGAPAARSALLARGGRPRQTPTLPTQHRAPADRAEPAAQP